MTSIIIGLMSKCKDGRIVSCVIISVFFLLGISVVGSWLFTCITFFFWSGFLCVPVVLFMPLSTASLFSDKFRDNVNTLPNTVFIRAFLVLSFCCFH